MNVINSDKMSEDFDENLKKNSEDDEEIDLTLKIDDLNSLISITNYTLLLMNFMIFQLTCRIDSNSIRLSIIQLTQKILSLNQKQFLIIKKILNHVICFCKKIIVKTENQIFFYIDDKNDVRKSQVIQIIEFEYELLQQKKKCC